MTAVRLGDTVKIVRVKMGLAEDDYYMTWRWINTRAQDICREKFGGAPLPKTDTLAAIIELREYFEGERDVEDPLTLEAARKSLKVSGAAAWIVHNAVKRNHEKYKKAQSAAKKETTVASSTTNSVAIPAPTPAEIVSASIEKNAAKGIMWDPVRDV